MYVEREAHAAAVLVARMQEGALSRAPVHSDIRSFDARALRGRVHWVAAGYPCQPFSVAGARRGVDDPRHLWPSCARIIGQSEPGLVFLENVGRHLRHGFYEVARELQAMGYRVAASLRQAAEAGAPHERERLFALGVHASEAGCESLRLLAERRQPNETIRQNALARDYGPLFGWEASGLLADADGRGRERVGTSDDAHGDLEAGRDAHGRGAGAPPANFWSAEPYGEPGIRRVADGVASRMDPSVLLRAHRKRACGNGVVPQQAELAFEDCLEALAPYFGVDFERRT